MPNPIGTAYVDVKFDDAQVRGQLRKLDGEIKQGTASMATVGKQGQKSMAQVEQSTGKVSKGFSALGGTLKSTAGLFGVGLGAAALVEGFKGATDAASNLNEQVNKTGAVFGKQGKTVLNWSKGLDESFGVSQRAALESAGIFGNMLRPMGLSAKQAANMSKRMVQLGGDMASFNNASPQETLDALRSGLAGETEPLRKYGVSLTAARVQAQALRMGLAHMVVDQTKVKVSTAKLQEAQKAQAEALKKHGKNSDEFRKATLGVETAQAALTKAQKGTVPTLTAAQKAQATYALIMKDTKAAQGDFAKTSGGVANQQRIMAARWEDLQAKIGQKFLPIVQKAQGAIIDLLGWLTKGSGGISKLSGYWQTLTRQGGPLAGAITNVRETIKSLGPIVDDVKAIIRDLQPVFQRMATYAAAQIKNLTTVLRGLATIVGGIVKIIRGILEGDWSQVWAGAKQVVSGLVTAVKGILNGLKTAITAEISVLGAIAKKLGGAIIDGIVNAVKAGAAGVGRAVGNLKTNVLSAVKGAAQWLVSTGENVVRGLLNGIRALAARELAGMTVFKDRVLAAVKGAGSWLYDAGVNIVTGMIRGITDKAGDAVSAVENLGKRMVSKAAKFWEWGSPSRVTHQWGVDIVGGLVRGIEVTTPAAVAAVQKLGQKAIEAARASMEGPSQRLADQLSAAFQKVQAAEPIGQAQKVLAAMQERGAPTGPDTLTASEQQLKDLQDARDEAARQAALTDAQAQLAKAKTDQQRLDAQKAYDDAAYAIQVAALEKSAEAERGARDAQTAAAQKQYEDDLAAQQAAADQEARAQEGHQFLEQQRFQTALAALQTYLQSTEATAAGARKRIAAIRDRFGIDMKGMGELLGKSFAQGVENTSDEVEKAATRLATAVQTAVEQLKGARKILKRKHPGGGAATGGGGGGGTRAAGYAALAAPAAAGDVTAGLAGPVPLGLQLSRTLSRIPPPAPEPTVVGVRVFIGDQELRAMVRTEVETVDTQTAAVLLAGVR